MPSSCALGRALLATIAALAACTSTYGKPKAYDYVPRDVVEIARFEVRSGAEVVGLLLQLEIRDPSGPLRYWRVETTAGAWAGHATEQGRFSRRVPFREDEEDLGMWPMTQGVARVLGIAGPVRLQAVEKPASEPSARPMR
jgi:hypothetical protein